MFNIHFTNISGYKNMLRWWLHLGELQMDCIQIENGVHIFWPISITTYLHWILCLHGEFWNYEILNYEKKFTELISINLIRLPQSATSLDVNLICKNSNKNHWVKRFVNNPWPIVQIRELMVVYSIDFDIRWQENEWTLLNI